MPQTGTQTEIKVLPSGITPTYNETIVVLESPNIQSANFRWIIDIYKGDSTHVDYEKLNTITILPNPEGYGVVDFHRHIENYIGTSFNPADVDRVSDKVLDDGFVWSFQVTEIFDSPIVWAFDDNNFDGGDLVFESFTNKHPYVVGDVINIEQSVPFTHASYNGDSTITAIIDEYAVKVNKSFISSTPVEGGISTLNSTESREIEQVFTAGSTTVKSFNGALSFQGFRNWDASDYLISTSSPNTTKFLINGSNTIDVTLQDRVWINSLMDTSPFQALVITTDNGEFIYQNAFLSPAEQHFINQNKIGAKDLLETTDTVIVSSGSLPVIDANTTQIQVKAVSNTGTQVAELITLNIVDKCSKHEAIRFFYLDKLGSYIPMTFDRVSKTNSTNTRSNYKQNYGNYDGVSNAWGYTSYTKGVTTYDLTTKEVVTCTSDWLNESQVNMVLDMLTSPCVYIQDANGDYIAINITTNSFEHKKTVNDKLMNYTISFEYAQTNTNQRG